MLVARPGLGVHRLRNRLGRSNRLDGYTQLEGVQVSAQESPAFRMRSNVRGLQSKAQEGNWLAAQRRAEAALNIATKTGPLRGNEQLFMAAGALWSAAMNKDTEGVTGYAKTVLALLAPLITAETLDRGSEVCDRCGDETGTHIRFADDGTEVLGDNCFDKDLETLPARQALARTYRMQPAVIGGRVR